MGFQLIGPGSIDITPGASSWANITVKRFKGRSGRVNLSIRLEAQLSSVLSTSTGQPTYQSVLTVTAAATLAEGDYPITVTATDGREVKNMLIVARNRVQPAAPVAGPAAPVLSSLSPSSITEDTGAFTLTVNGSGFVSGAVILWNGSSRTTTFVNSGQVTPAILAGDITTPGTASVVATNPGSVNSNTLTFTINASGAAANYYVNGSTGSSGNDGLAATVGGGHGPKATIAQGLGLVSTSAGAGANIIVEVAAGTYAESFGSIPSGTSGNVFTLRGKAGDTVTIRPSSDITIFDLTSGSSNNYQYLQNLVLDGVNQTGTKFGLWHYNSSNITLDGVEVKNTSGSAVLIQAHNATVKNCTIHDCGNTRLDHGLYCTASNCVFESNVIYNIGGFGVHIFSNDPPPYNSPSNNIVRKNIIYDFIRDPVGAATGILASVGTGNVIYNNLVYTTDNNPEAYAISMDPGNACYNNTLYHCAAQGIGALAGSTARNNLIYQCGTDTSGAGTFSNNWVTSNGNPNVVSLVTPNFHLTSGSSSTLKTGGFNLTGTVPDDFDGVAYSGGVYSIGAYSGVSL